MCKMSYFRTSVCRFLNLKRLFLLDFLFAKSFFSPYIAPLNTEIDERVLSKLAYSVRWPHCSALAEQNTFVVARHSYQNQKTEQKEDFHRCLGLQVHELTRARLRAVVLFSSDRGRKLAAKLCKLD